MRVHVCVLGLPVYIDVTFANNSLCVSVMQWYLKGM